MRSIVTVVAVLLLAVGAWADHGFKMNTASVYIDSLAPYGAPGTPSDEMGNSKSTVISLKGTIIVLNPYGTTQHPFRSTDSGATWQRLYSHSSVGVRGAMVIDKDSIVYHFFANAGDGTYASFRKFKYSLDSASIGATRHFQHYDSVGMTRAGAYATYSALVDTTNRIWVAFHAGRWARGDSMFVTYSDDTANTWSTRLCVSGATTDTAYRPKLFLNPITNQVHLLWQSYYGFRIYHSRNTGTGTWSTPDTVSQTASYSNAFAMFKSADTAFMFCNNSSSPDTGIYYKRSIDSAKTWGSWTQIAITPGYGDCGGFIDTANNIYVAFRGLGVAEGATIGIRTRARIIRSSDNCATWTMVDSAITTYRQSTSNNCGFWVFPRFTDSYLVNHYKVYDAATATNKWGKVYANYDIKMKYSYATASSCTIDSIAPARIKRSMILKIYSTTLPDSTANSHVHINALSLSTVGRWSTGQVWDTIPADAGRGRYMPRLMNNTDIIAVSPDSIRVFVIGAP